jgi:hypothetical protein
MRWARVRADSSVRSAADKSIRIGVVFTSADSPYIGVAGQGSRWIPPSGALYQGAHVMYGTRDPR